MTNLTCELSYIERQQQGCTIHAMGAVSWVKCWHTFQVELLYLLFKLIHNRLELISVLSHLIQLTLCLSQLPKTSV